MSQKYIFFFLFLGILLLTATKLQPYNTTEVKPARLVSNPYPVDRAAELRGILGQYDSLISNEVKESGTVGAAIAVVYKGQVAFMKCFGVRKAGEKGEVDQNTIFRLGSVSKTITGVLAGILSEEGVLDLDTRVKDVIPGFRLKSEESTELLTVRNLLSHTTGLVPHAYDLLVEDHVPFHIIMDSLRRVNISAPPGKLYGYQNVMFSLYDTLSEVTTSQDFGTLLSDHVFEPFGMYHASTGFSSFKNNPDKAYPHYRSRRGYRPLPLNDRYYNTLPAAGINASISDMAQFLRVMQSRPDLGPVLDTVFSPQINSPLRWSYLRYWDHVDSKQYALGWRIIGYKGRKIAYHAGYVDGYKSEIALCKTEDIGIVYLTNSPNKVASVSVPEFLNLYFDLKDSSGHSNGHEELASR